MTKTDSSQLREENKRLQKELKQKEKELSFFIEIGKALTSTLDLKKVLSIIMEKAQKLVSSEAWSLLLVDEITNELVFKMAKGERSDKVKKFRLKMGEGIAGWVAKGGAPLIVPDVSKDTRFFKGVDKATKFKTKSILCVPIINNNKTIGVLEMINKKDGNSFDEKELNLLLKLVDQAAIAIERAGLYKQMEELVLTDDLTKLFNFRHLEQTLDTEIRRCQRYNLSFSIIFMDLDYFKNINDTHGHLMGSKTLIEVAQLLISCLREVDVVARYGGDEFVVVLPQTDTDTTHRITKRIQKAIRGYIFLKEEGINVKLTASFGIASYPDHAKSKRDLIRLADEAMYRVKNMNRDGITIAQPGE